MHGTIISIIVGAVLWIFQSYYTINVTLLQVSAISLALLALTVRALTSVLAYGPLQRVEQNLTPRLLDMYSTDRELRLTWGWVCIFSLASIILGILEFRIGEIGPVDLMIIWIIGLGVTFDLYRLFVFRVLGYFNPFMIIQQLKKKAVSAIQDEREADLCIWIDALAEVCMKSLGRGSTSLCQNAIDEIQQITKIFLSSSKSISHTNTDEQLQALGVDDKVSFILFYIFQRLEMIHTRSVELKLEPVSSFTVTAMGKIAIAAASLDLSLVSYPLHFLGKFAQQTIRAGMSDVGKRATITLVEVAKVIINDVDLKYGELQEPFFTLIHQLESISKDLFRQNKSINFKIINQPFLDLKELFKNEKVASHQDTPSIVADINRVLDEFMNLEVVMRTIPPVASIIQEENVLKQS